MIRRVLAFSAVLLAVVVVAPAPVRGHYFDVPVMDDNRVDFASDESNLDHHLFWNHFVYYQVQDQYDARTDLYDVPQCRFCWNENTDIVWFATYIHEEPGQIVYGNWTCRRWINAVHTVCDRGRLLFQERYSRAVSSDAGFFLACHEIGHAVGLKHFSDGCMHGSGSLYPPPSDGTLSSHMIYHVNYHY